MGRLEEDRKIEDDVTSFPDPEERKPHEKESERGIVKGIGKRYDVLLAERERLREELKRYNCPGYARVLSPDFLSDSELQEILSSWKEKARKETDFFAPLDSLGIEIFAEDLDQQSNFHEEDIVFGSTEIRRDNLLNDQPEKKGRAKRYEPLIEMVNGI